MTRPPPRSTLFPYTPLFRSHAKHESHVCAFKCLFNSKDAPDRHARPADLFQLAWNPHRWPAQCEPATEFSEQMNVDRKSTRLNSSHVRISYAVFCLKKKKKQ